MASVDSAFQKALSLGLDPRTNKNGFSCRCPVHGDQKDRHLYIHPGDKQQLIAYCHHGCAFIDIARAFGWDREDAREPDDQQRPDSPIHHRYTDERGQLLYEVVRYRKSDGTKSIYSRRPDGKGGWENNLDGVRLVLYRLQPLLRADPSKPVLMAEGEACADLLAGTGLPATTTAQGAGKATLTNFIEPLLGRRVAFFPDYDQKGMAHAEEVVKRLRSARIEAAIVQIPGFSANGKHGDDIVDWVRRDGHSLMDAVQLAEAALDPASTYEWPEPLPLYGGAVPPFPTDVFPDWLKEMVEAVGVATQTPADMAAMLALSVLATAVQKRCEAYVRKGWREPLSLWTVTALPPGNRKSPAYFPMVEPIFRYEGEQVENMRVEIAAAQTEHEIMEGSLKRLKDQAIKSKNPLERDELARQAANLAEKIERQKVPVSPRLVVDDTTQERLGMLLAEHGGRMAVISDEGDVFDMMAGRYSSGAANIGIYLRGHSGGDVIVDRVNRPSLMVRHAAITLGLTIQPQVLLGITTNPTFKGRGLLGRILYALPKSTLGEREVRSAPVPAEVFDRYRVRITACLQTPCDLDPLKQPIPHDIPFSPEADDEVAAFEHWIEPRLKPGQPLGYMADWAGKLAGEMVRIAALLHVAELAGVTTPWEHPVDRETVQAARQVAEYLIPHARAAFQAMGADPALNAASEILAWIKERGQRTFQKRDAHRGMQSLFAKSKDLDEPLLILIDHGYLRELPEKKREGAGQPSSPTFAVHPQVLEP